MSEPGRTAAKAKSAGRSAEQAGHEVEHSKSFARLVMVGLIVFGVIHLLVAWIALDVAWTGSSRQASQKGAFQQMASNPFGDVLVWVTALGLFVLTIWQIFEAIWGYRDFQEKKKRISRRLRSAGRAITYLVLGVIATSTAVGGKSSKTSSNSSEQSLTAKLLSEPYGRILVVLIGVVIVVISGRLIYRGLSKNFTEDMDGGVSSAILGLGQVGYIAKGIVLAIVGVLFVIAAVTFDPKKAGGMDAALRTLRDQPFGPYLLTLMALGLACFGFFCFAWARHPRKS